MANAFASSDTLNSSTANNIGLGQYNYDDSDDADTSDDEREARTRQIELDKQTAHTLQLQHDANKRREEKRRVADFEKLMRERDAADQAKRQNQDEEARAHREKLEADSRSRIQLLEERARQRLQCTTQTVDLTADAPGRTAGPPPWTPPFSLPTQTFDRDNDPLEDSDYEGTDPVTGTAGPTVWTEQQIADNHNRMKLAQEADLRVKQLERVENQKREAAVRAKQEAEAHATRENLCRIQTAIAEKELGRTPESRTHKVPAHLMMKSENCQSVALVAAHLHKLNSEPEKDRVKS